MSKQLYFHQKALLFHQPVRLVGESRLNEEVALSTLSKLILPVPVLILPVLILPVLTGCG